MPTLPKKASFTRRFTDMVAPKAPKAPRSMSFGRGDHILPTSAIITPPSSPRSIQQHNSSPQSTRYTYDEGERLPVTFLPLLSTDALKELDVFGEGTDSANLFGLSQSPADSEESWFSMPYDRPLVYEVPQTRKMSTASSTSTESGLSTHREVTIGWICEDGFRPIGFAD